MKFLVVHPGSSVSTHDVFMGLQEAIIDLGHDVSVYPLDRRIAAAGKFLRDQRQMEIEKLSMDLPSDVSHAEIILQASEGLIVRALTSNCDWVVIVSGMYVPLIVLQVLRLAKIKVALVLTESPYDEEQEAKWSAAADVTFSNERTTARKIGAHYLPHAWRMGMHNRTEGELPKMHAHDCVFVGTGFGERAEWIRRFTNAGAPLTLYGTWPQAPLKPYLADPERDQYIVSNEEAAALYVRAKCSLNLYRTSKGDTGFSDTPEYISEAESMNPRAYELAAAGCLHVSTPRDEVTEKFGALVPQAETPEEAADIVRFILTRDDFTAKRVRYDMIRAVAEDTWHHRARTLIDVLNA